MSEEPDMNTAALKATVEALEGLVDLLKGYERYQTPIDLAAVRERMKMAREALAITRGRQ